MAESAAFTITGPQNLLLDEAIFTDSSQIPVYEYHVSANPGFKEPVSLSIAGLPPQMNAELLVNQGVPPFKTVLKLRPAEVGVGTSYPFTITGKSNTLTRTLNGSLKITVSSACGLLLAGRYQRKSEVAYAGFMGPDDSGAVILVNPANPTEIRLPGLYYDANDTATATVNCQNHSFNAYAQHADHNGIRAHGVGTYKITGSGVTLSITTGFSPEPGWHFQAQTVYSR